MAALILKTRLAAELAPINKALDDACEALPAPVLPIVRHILNAGGKRLRPFLTICTARLLGHDRDDIYGLAVTMEMLHAATLLHDDVLDNAVSRRGQPAAHTVFNAASVILAGDALLARANAIVAQFGNPALSQCFSEATSRTAAGEILEISCMRRVDLSEAEYLQIAHGKTACLLGESCRLGAVRAKASPGEVRAAYDFGLNLGLAFQIVDDALDFAPGEQTGKPTGGDAREGKLTPPLRLYRQSLGHAEREAFDRAFANGTIDEQMAGEIAKSIREKGFDHAARQIAGEYLQKARDAAGRLPDRPERKILLLMADYVGAREK